MPNLPTHIYLAYQVAQHLGWGEAYDQLGSCFLGSTAPDIRVMTKWPREHTHFAPLSVASVGAGARRMFELHPELGDHRKLSPATQAFILGYISHLTADEVWIINIFRPYFDPPEADNLVTDNQVEAHIWDRALQLDMDRNARRQLDVLCQLSDVMATSEQGVDLAFLGRDTLLEWREWVCRFLSWEFTWDRLKRALNRMYRDDLATQQQVDRFLAAMPGSLERIYQTIPEEKLATYQQQVVAGTLAQVQEYWGEA